MSKLNSFLIKCRRVWHTMKKPTKEEFQMISKVSAIGILIIGFLGFLLSLFMKVFIK